MGDLAVKLVVNLALLAPFRALMWNLARPANMALDTSAVGSANR
jgi:hypothetical protein